ncbi:MAG: DegQ family serine endoprotease [Rhizobiaceae bacterium]|nr:DegQ family serine endoprotease [Rhizobiaceae bacterium]
MSFFTSIKGVTKLAAAAGLAVSIVAAQPAIAPNTQAYAQGPVSVADLAEGLMSAVVNISTSQKVENNTRRNIPIPRVPEGSPFQDFFNDLFPQGPEGENNSPRTRNSLGSGFVIDEKGIIITNNHVIADADEITVNFSDGSKLVAELVGTDPKTDIAVLKVEPEGKLNAVPFGDSGKARIGDWVMAIGNPFGLGGSVSLGIVSAVERDISSGPYDNFIQTDAAINRGNSGGPLFNMNGEVVGINTAIISPSGGSIGIGFSIPSNLATRVIDQLVEFGETRRGWLGVQIQTVTDEIAESLGLSRASGALVSGVVKDGPAEKSGLKSGDVILTFDGQDVAEMRDLPIIVAETAVDKEVDVVVWRKGKEQTVGVKLGRLEDGEKKNASLTTGNEEQEDEPVTKPLLGLTLSEITDETREDAKIGEDTKGLFINEVEAGSAAQDKGIQAGEVIVQIGQEPVETLEEAEEQVAKLKEEGRKNALLMVSSATGDIRFVVVRIE